MLLTTLALAASVMLVVWTVGSYDSILHQSDHIARECLGDFDLLIMGSRREAKALDSELVGKIESDPQVTQCFAVHKAHVSIHDLQRKQMRPCFASLLGLVEGLRPFELAEGRLPEKGKDEIVLAQSVARRVGLKLGDDFWVQGPSGSFKLKLVGVARQAMSLLRIPDAYVHAPLLEQVTGKKRLPNILYLQLQKGVATSTFVERYELTKYADSKQVAASQGPDVVEPGKDKVGHQEKSEQIAKKLRVISRNTIASQLDQEHAITAMKMQGYFAASIVTLAAIFIVFTTLSMGVSERSRQLAILRAIGLTRRQVVLLILGECFFLAIIGWIIGVGLGVGLLKAVAAWQSEVFVNGIVVSPKCLVLTLVAAVVSSTVAGVLPAFSATRLRPLDALAPRQNRPISFTKLIPVSLIGLTLLAISPWITFHLDVVPDTRAWLFAFLGCPTGLVGFVLLTPLVILVSERIFIRPLGRAIGIQRQLLQHQLSGNLWRTVGTCISLSTGLGLFVAVQTWGNSMLDPFLPGDGLPDAMVSILPSGLDAKQVESVLKIDPIDDNACVPLVVDQVKLSKKTLNSPGFDSVKQDKLLLMGFNANRAIGGKSPVVGMTFIEGSRQKAIEKLSQKDLKLDAPRYCIVPDHFSTQTGLSVGDRFEVVLPKEKVSEEESRLDNNVDSDKSENANMPKMIQYEIAGVVSIPGWHWVTKLTNMQQRSHRTWSTVFLGEAQTRQDYHLGRTSHFWMKLKNGVTSETLEAAIKPIADQTVGTKVTIPLFGEITVFRPFVNVLDIRELDRTLRRQAASILWLLSIFPLLTLIITSLAVINTVIMSVRVRRWEFGVLRSIGMTRSQLFRTVLGEAILIGLTACFLSFLFGVGAAWCATGLCRHVFFVGGLTPPIILPWLKLSVGFGITLSMCLAAALIPAINTSRKEPLSLLQSGRQSM